VLSRAAGNCLTAKHQAAGNWRMIRAYRVTISALCLKLCEGLSPRIKQKAGGRYAADLFLQLPARGSGSAAILGHGGRVKLRNPEILCTLTSRIDLRF
jgi:hypothetical protein